MRPETHEHIYPRPVLNCCCMLPLHHRNYNAIQAVSHELWPNSQSSCRRWAWVATEKAAQRQYAGGTQDAHFVSSSVHEPPMVRGEGRLSRGDGPQSRGDGPQSRGDGPQSRGDGRQSPGDGPQSRGDGPQSERGSLLRGPRGPLGSSSATTLRAVLSTVALDCPAGERRVPPAEPGGSAQRGR